VQQLKSYLPLNATTTISNSAAGREFIEIAVPMDNGLIDLGYPRLSGTFKEVNGTWSVKFTTDFLLLEKTNGDFIFEAETVSINRNQFKTQNIMIQRLEQLYAIYYDKVLNCNFTDNNDVINHIVDYFDNTVSILKIIDTNTAIYIGEH